LQSVTSSPNSTEHVDMYYAVKNYRYSTRQPLRRGK